MILYEKKEKESRKEYAYRILKENIMSLELKPGELLSEVELSEKLNISRTPIREVLMRLKNEHLIEVKPQSTVGDNDLMNRISLKITEYKNEINYIDNQINTLYGRAFRNGGNVDESQVNKLENEMNTYKKKIELLEPIYEVLKEV